MLELAKFGSKSPFVPSINIALYIVNIGERLTNKLRDIVVQEEQYILDNFKTIPDWMPNHSSKNEDRWLTNRLWDYNLFDFSTKYPELNEVKSWIYSQYVDYCKAINVPVERVYIQCWANIVYNDGRRIISHHHADGHLGADQEYSYCSGNICIQAVNTHTYYQNPFLDKKNSFVKNVAGDLTLFPSFVVHYTDANLSEVPRISIAFDIITEEVYNMMSHQNGNYRLLSPE